MKLNRTYLFIAISSLALVLVLIIQINWIFQTAKTKEEMFNEKVNLVLGRTTDALLADAQVCERIETSAEIQGPFGYTAALEKSEIQKIDSLLNHSMKFYGFHIDYSFEIIKSGMPSAFKNDSDSSQIACGQIGLEEVVNKNGFELKLIFPEKNQFIIAEMGTLFIASLILIIIVLVLFWRTVSSLIKEKRISEHTTDFLNNMTHEFKTPLTNIALAGKMIIKDESTTKIKHYSGIILEENEKLRLQVEQVLSMTALERGEIPIQLEELDFHALIRDAIRCIGIQIENRQGTINLKLEAAKFVFMGDPTHLTNALCNLIDNAIKYSEGKPEITIQTYNRGQEIVIMISDKGIGIEKKYQKKVFDKFFRVPKGDVHDVKGFGLGLSYIKTIIEMHGGTIEVVSETTKDLPETSKTGTTFMIALKHV